MIRQCRLAFITQSVNHYLYTLVSLDTTIGLERGAPTARDFWCPYKDRGANPLLSLAFYMPFFTIIRGNFYVWLHHR